MDEYKNDILSFFISEKKKKFFFEGPVFDNSVKISRLKAMQRDLILFPILSVSFFWNLALLPRCYGKKVNSAAESDF